MALAYIHTPIGLRGKECVIILVVCKIQQILSINFDKLSQCYLLFQNINYQSLLMLFLFSSKCSYVQLFFQAAFLSALAGVEIAEAAARAAVTTLSEVDGTTAIKGGRGSLSRNLRRGINGLWFYSNSQIFRICLLSCICLRIRSSTWDFLKVSPYLTK